VINRSAVLRVLESSAGWVDGTELIKPAVGLITGNTVESPEMALTAGDVGAVKPIASVTKLLSAYAILIAVEEGSIALDTPAGPPGSTIAHLLAHASGLAPNGPRALVAPGTRRIYSSESFRVLGAALANATGLPFATYVREAVLDPLGMAHTTFDEPGAGSHSNVLDLVALCREFLSPTLIAASTLATATTAWWPELDGVLPGFGRQEPNPWGLGFELRGDKSPHWMGSAVGPRSFGHFGQRGAFLWVDPVRKVGVVCVCDRPFGPWASEQWPRWNDELARAFHSRHE
jgi:CubicO group peptidase (beta-lactamase class C family)